MLSTDPLLRFQRVALSPVDGYICSRVDGVLTAREILAITPGPAERAERSLFGLLCIGMLEWLPATTPPASAEAPPREEVIEAFANIGARDHYQVLGVSPEANEDEIKAAYYRLARRFHPDIQHHPALADLGQQVSAVFRRQSAAFKVLSDAQLRADYDSTLVVARLGLGPQAVLASEPQAVAVQVDPEVAARQADEALRRAEEAFEQSRYWDAIATLEDETVPHALGRTRQRARLLLAQCYRKNPKWTKRAEEELRAALQDDPTDPNALFALGMLYKEQRVWSRSAAMFREVLALKPRHAAARAELESLPAGG